MATIDKLDIGIYIQYAKRTQFIEEINEQYRLGDAASVAPHTSAVDLFPRPSELDSLLGSALIQTPWAYFHAPDSFRDQRRSTFGFHRIVPSMGTVEKQAADTSKLQAMRTYTPQEKEEKEAILSCFNQIDKINDWMGFIVGRMGQFLQG